MGQENEAESRDSSERRPAADPASELVALADAVTAKSNPPARAAARRSWRPSPTVMVLTGGILCGLNLSLSFHQLARGRPGHAAGLLVAAALILLGTWAQHHAATRRRQQDQPRD